MGRLGGVFATAASEEDSSCEACRLPRPVEGVAGEMLEEVMGTAIIWDLPQRQSELGLATYTAPLKFLVLGNREEFQLLFPRSKLRTRSGTKILGRK